MGRRRSLGDRQRRRVEGGRSAGSRQLPGAPRSALGYPPFARRCARLGRRLVPRASEGQYPAGANAVADPEVYVPRRKVSVRASVTARSCRLCSATLNRSFCDLGMSPLSNAFLNADQLNAMEPFYPLHAWVCEKCFLVQLEEFESPAHIFGDYAYFSSYSDTWLAHARDYVERGTQRFGFGPASRGVGLASNDGYLLQYFKTTGIHVFGIEPAPHVGQL